MRRDRKKPETRKKKNSGNTLKRTPRQKQQEQFLRPANSSSDAESKVGWRWPEVPHWESQLVRIIELVGASLVGHVGMEKLP